ncbi:unnamed protein product, partial [Rotaria sordida]
KLQDEIKSKNSRVSSVIEICDRLKADYQQQIEQIPFDYASDLENRWHQLWINSVEVQCKLEERFKILNVRIFLLFVFMWAYIYSLTFDKKKNANYY